MALSNENGNNSMVMPVAPMYGGYGHGNTSGWGNFGGDGALHRLACAFAHGIDLYGEGTVSQEIRRRGHVFLRALRQ